MKQKSLLISTFFIISVLISHVPSASADTLKIGFVTDWEHGKSNGREKLSSRAKKYLETAVKGLNDKNPHLVIGGGDYIEGTKLSTKTAKAQLKEINKIFKTVDTKKRYYLPGNHDLRSLTKNEYKKALGINYFHKKIDTKGFRILLLDTNFQEDGDHRSNETYIEGYVSDEEIAWLRHNINSSPYPVIIFSHHSPIRPKDRRDIKNSDPLRTVIKESGKVAAVISGHNPTQLMKEEDGVRYIVVNNLVDKRARKTYAYIKISKIRGVLKFSLKQYGSKKKTFSFSKGVNY